MNRYKAGVIAALFFFACTVTVVYADSASGSGQGKDSETAVEQEYDDFDLGSEFEDEFAAGPVFDPLGGYNRFMTRVNDKLYFWILKPVAKGFSIVIPESGRLAISRCFRNILFPIRFVNNLLQLKFKRAGIETARFGVNTTIGVLGLRDPAKSWLNLEACEEDFGQTLGHYGIGSGFHLVLPILGPSNVRDTVGLAPDIFLNPIFYLDSLKYSLGIRAFDLFNYTSLHIGEYESLKRDAIDLYTFMRDAYEQNRKTKIAE